MKNCSVHTQPSHELLQSRLDSIQAVMRLLLHMHIAQESCAPDFGPQLNDIIWRVSQKGGKKYCTTFKDPTDR